MEAEWGGAHSLECQHLRAWFAPPVLQEFSKEDRDPVKTHEGWGVMLPCNPPAHYPGEPGPGVMRAGTGGIWQLTEGWSKWW